MALSWNEIKDRALAFSNEWKDTAREEADAKPFLVEFFNVFGINRKKVATFEEKVKKLDDGDGYIDLFWKGTLLIEMKSRGKSLDKAFRQAKDYLQRVPQHELPKYIMVSDFELFRLTDLEEDKTISFMLKDFVKNVQHFGFIAGYQKRSYKEQDPVNIQAAELMGKLHDQLKAIGYEGHPLEVYLVRLLFCLFAEDTTIFNKQSFTDFIAERTAEDGSDLADRLAHLFQVLNTPDAKRLKNLDEQLRAFPYVNGKLFEEVLSHAHFDKAMRNALLECCRLDWGKISPAIFGSMFQSVMNPVERRNLGAHYTSETNILKLIKPLFLDELRLEFESLKGNARKLAEFHKKLSTLTFLDPACGCGNFLVITYRELRLLELEVLSELRKTGQGVLDVREIIWLDVDQFYGIEYEEFPARIAEVAMWLMDHQMNMAVSEAFGQYFVRLPLKKAANIVHGNALRTDWQSLLNKENALTVHADLAEIVKVEERELRYKRVKVFAKEIAYEPSEEQTEVHFSYILGNPPFIGSKMMNETQRADIVRIFPDVPNAGTLDYVSGWYGLAGSYIHTHSDTRVGFVSTNSIVQGEQVGTLWPKLLLEQGLQIQFAHQTFQWTNEARGKAAVHCVIIGFGKPTDATKRLFVYNDSKSEPVEIAARNINAYLVDGPDVFIQSRQKPLCDVPEIGIGNQPIDGGHYLFTTAEKKEFLKREPAAKRWFRRWLGSDEFINGYERWCLWLGDCPPEELKAMPEVLKRVKAVREMRLASKRPATRKIAETPTRFLVENMPKRAFLIIPEVSSERRTYIPIGFEKPSTLASNLVKIVPDATLYHFGVLTSKMHMAWVKYVCGRLESRYRYSKDIVYNNFPWPNNPTSRQIAATEAAAQRVLDARAKFPDSSLADLYDPLSMPAALTKAHQALDKAVDLAYRSQSFTSEAKRMEFLFELYKQYAAGLFAKAKGMKTAKIKSKFKKRDL